MLWLLIIALVGVMLFVMFHKPSVNTAGAHWVPPQQRLDAPPQQPNATADGSGAQPLPQAPKTVETFDFNDLYGSKKPTQPPASDDLPRG
jgi:hypothetical protein